MDRRTGSSRSCNAIVYPYGESGFLTGVYAGVSADRSPMSRVEDVNKEEADRRLAAWASDNL